jgi:ribose 5-phosphate isomerase B
MKNIALGADHAGFEYKEHLKKWLDAKGYTTKDFGTYNTDSADYADFAHPVAIAVEKNESDFGLLICGSANGIAITANRIWPNWLGLTIMPMYFAYLLGLFLLN